MSDQIKACGLCDFFKASTTHIGACLRFPPRIAPQTTPYSRYPTVHYTEWCGEYKPGAWEKRAAKANLAKLRAAAEAAQEKRDADGGQETYGEEDAREAAEITAELETEERDLENELLDLKYPGWGDSPNSGEVEGKP